jgi:hypothetical protein
MKSESEIYYDPETQALWKEGWIVPIEEVGVERINNYTKKE